MSFTYDNKENHQTSRQVFFSPKIKCLDVTLAKMKNQIFIILLILTLWFLSPANSLATNARIIHGAEKDIFAQVDLRTPNQPNENYLPHSLQKKLYSVTRKISEEGNIIWDTSVTTQKVNLISDAVSFPHTLLPVDGQSEIRQDVHKTVIHLNYKRSYKLLGEIFGEKNLLEQDITLTGMFGRFDELTTQNLGLPSRVCMAAVIYRLGKNHLPHDWLGRKRVLILAQAPTVLSGNPNSFDEDTLKIDWLIRGILTSGNSNAAQLQFSFNGAVTYKPQFYASNFKAQSTSELITIDHSINSGKDITITIKEAISVPILLGKVFAVLATIILVLRFKDLKRWLTQFSNNRRSPKV